MDVAILIALSTAIGSLIVALATRRKLNSEAAEAISQATLTLLNPLKDRIKELETTVHGQEERLKQMESEVKLLRQENAELRAGVEMLSLQIKSLGREPVYQPKDDAERKDR